MEETLLLLLLLLGVLGALALAAVAEAAEAVLTVAVAPPPLDLTFEILPRLTPPPLEIFVVPVDDGIDTLPGTGNPNFANFMKYFCTRLATCFADRVPSAFDILLYRCACTCSSGYISSSSSSRRYYYNIIIL